MPSIPEIILNSWWQGIVLTLLVWFALRDQTRLSAATRLAIWQVTLAVVVLLPVLQCIGFIDFGAKEAPAPAVKLQVPAAKPVETRAEAAPVIKPVAPDRPVFELNSDDVVKVLVVVGSILGALRMLQLVVAYIAIRMLKRRSTECDVPLPKMLGRDARVLLNSRICMPLAVGFRSPAILLPERMVRALTAEQLDQVVLHEAAHLERKDDWWALGERIVRALFTIQPAVWLIGRQIDRERELACDDWVIAQCGEAKSYAAALTRVAEVGPRGWMPMLATGAGRRKEIFQRVEAILDQTRNKIPSASEPMVLAASLLLLFVVTQGAPMGRLFGFPRFDNRNVVDDGNTRREFSMKGDIDFTEDETDVAALTPGSRMMLSRDEHWMSRRIEIEANEEGKIIRRYFVSGVAQPFGSEAKRFLAKELPLWMKNQTKELPKRLNRWVDTGGVESALRELDDVHNNGVKREYIEELLRRSSVDSVQLRRILRMAEDLDNDGDKERLLDLVGQQAKAMGLEPALFDVIQKIHSDNERGRLLERMLREMDESSLPRLLRAVAEVHSDERKADLLEQTSKEVKRELPSQYFEVAKGLHSDDRLRGLLINVLEQHGKNVSTQQEVLTLIKRLHSEDNKRDVMKAVLAQAELRPEVIDGVRKQADQLHSNDHRQAVRDAITAR